MQGKTPLEFDGTDLDNSSTSPGVLRRILGKHAVNLSSRGTAEPEMRGIYMLLTMNNEGGMEVLKYAAKLFEDRPEIYYSPPVQLALDIFKVRCTEPADLCVSCIFGKCLTIVECQILVRRKRITTMLVSSPYFELRQRRTCFAA